MFDIIFYTVLSYLFVLGMRSQDKTINWYNILLPPIFCPYFIGKIMILTVKALHR